MISGMINNVSNMLPPSPLLTQFHDIPPDAFCSEDCVDMTSLKHCQCLHVIKLPLGAVVEFILVDTGIYKWIYYNFNSMKIYSFHFINFYLCHGNNKKKIIICVPSSVRIVYFF